MFFGMFSGSMSWTEEKSLTVKEDHAETLCRGLPTRHGAVVVILFTNERDRLQ